VERLRRLQHITDMLRDAIESGHVAKVSSPSSSSGSASSASSGSRSSSSRSSSSRSSSTSPSSSISLDRSEADELKAHLKEAARILRRHGSVMPRLQAAINDALTDWPKTQDLASPSGSPLQPTRTPQNGVSESSGHVHNSPVDKYWR
jgi:hypothetical protein